MSEDRARSKRTYADCIIRFCTVSAVNWVFHSELNVKAYLLLVIGEVKTLDLLAK